MAIATPTPVVDELGPQSQDLLIRRRPIWRDVLLVVDQIKLCPVDPYGVGIERVTKRVIHEILEDTYADLWTYRRQEIKTASCVLMHADLIVIRERQLTLLERVQNSLQQIEFEVCVGCRKAHLLDQSESCWVCNTPKGDND